MANNIPAKDVLTRAFAMPLENPAYPPPPDRFLDRVSLTVSYRSDIDKVAALVPEPLTVSDPIVGGRSSTGCYPATAQPCPLGHLGRDERDPQVRHRGPGSRRTAGRPGGRRAG
jgi:acetoacetate decarboxylase